MFYSPPLFVGTCTWRYLIAFIDTKKRQKACGTDTATYLSLDSMEKELELNVRNDSRITDNFGETARRTVRDEDTVVGNLESFQP